jgi:hypothetical protein
MIILVETRLVRARRRKLRRRKLRKGMRSTLLLWPNGLWMFELSYRPICGAAVT